MIIYDHMHDDERGVAKNVPPPSHYYYIISWSKYKYTNTNTNTITIAMLLSSRLAASLGCLLFAALVMILVVVRSAYYKL